MLTRYPLSVILLAFMAIVQVHATIDRTMLHSLSAQVFVELDIVFPSVRCSS